MLKPARLDLEIIQGSTFFETFTWQEGTEAINLTGYTFRMQIRESLDSTVVLAEYSSATGEFYIDDDPALGKFYLEVPFAETAGYTFTKGVYDIEVIYPDARVFRILEGRVTLSKEVTR